MSGSRTHAPRISFLAIRSGDYTPFAGAANINSGVTMDQRAMDNVIVNSNHTIVSVGAGSIWGNVYEKFQPMNLTILRARVAGLVSEAFSQEVSLFPFSRQKVFLIQ